MKINFRKFFCKFFNKGLLYKLFDCQRYEEKASEEPENPKPEYVEVKICLDSMLLAGNYCPISRIEKRKFIKREEPKEICNIHKKPSPKPKPIPIERHLPVHLELYACFLDYCLKNNEDFWRGLFRRLREETMITTVTFFPYAIEPKGLYNAWTPWQKKEGKWDLECWKETYWTKLRKFTSIARGEGILLVPVLFPGKYGNAPYRKNHQNVVSEWRPEALKYQRKFMRRLMNTLRNKYDDTPLWVRLSNEVAHRGDHQLGLLIAKQHEAWYLAIKDFVQLDHVISDTTYSDFTIGALVEKHEYCGEILGKDEYDRKIWPEIHDVNLKTLNEPYEPGVDKTLWNLINGGTRWQHFVLSTDGCGWGSGYQIPNTEFRNMNREELREFAALVWKKIKPSIKIIIAELPKEIFIWRDGILVEDFSRLDFDRLKVFKEIK